MAKQIHQPFPGRASSGLAMSSVICCKVGLPSTQMGGASTWAVGSAAVAFPLTVTMLVLIGGSLRGLQGITNLFQVPYIWPRSHIVQHAVIAPASLHLGNAAVWIFKIAEYDCLRRAGLLARGLYLAIGQFAFSLQRNILGQLDPLYAHAAFFHHAARTHRDIWVQNHAPERALHVEIELRIFRVVVPIEAAHLVRAIIRTVARANAAVVNLLVEPLRTGAGGQHRTDCLAWRVLAMLAHHRLVNALGIVFCPAVIAVNADPVHDAGAFDLVFADHGNVVFRLACNHARGTACA